MIEAKKKKKRRSTSRRNNKAGSAGVDESKALWTNLALPCVAGTKSVENPYKNRLMQNQAMEITAGRAIAMRHRAILGDFASPRFSNCYGNEHHRMQNRAILLQCDRPLTWPFVKLPVRACVS